MLSKFNDPVELRELPTPAPATVVKFRCQKFAPVYLACWAGEQDTCGICEEKIFERCVNCQATDNPVCRYEEGACGHLFHHHCIQRWVSDGHPTCPYDQAPWRPTDP